MRRGALALLGAYLCVVGAVLHRHLVHVGGVTVPWALLLVIGGTYAVVVAAGQVVRLGGAWCGLGWAVALLGQQLSPGESYLVASDWLGWVFTAGTLGAIVVGVLRAPRLGR